MFIPKEAIFFIHINNINKLNKWHFQISAQLWRVIMMMHMVQYNYLYSESLKTIALARVRFKEKVIWAIFLFYVIFTNLLVIVIAIIQLTSDWSMLDSDGKISYITESSACKAYKILDQIMDVHSIVSISWIIVVELLIFAILIRLLFKNLHFYYSKLLKSLILQVILCELYFGFLFIKIWNLRYFMKNYRFLLTLKHFKLEYSTGELVVWMIINILTKIPFYILVYLNIKDINFEMYLRDVMKGAGIIQYYPSNTVFIIDRSSSSEPKDIKSNLLTSFNDSSTIVLNNQRDMPMFINGSSHFAYQSMDTSVNDTSAMDSSVMDTSVNEDLYKQDYLKYKNEERKLFKYTKYKGDYI